MASNTTNFGLVQTLYIAFYQRPADPDGLVFWANEVTTKGRDAVINAFATSDEATALYGAITNDNIVSVVNQIYQALFNRDAEVATTTDEALGTVAGENFYVSGFKAGKFTPGQIALNVFDGVRGDDATVLANKVAYANEFTAQVDGRPFTDANFGLLTTVDAVTYNADDVTAARVALQAVTASTAVTPALVATDVQGTIANEGDTAFSVANGVVTAPAALTQIRATFVSAEVGNGNANNAAGALAVALQQEDNADALIAAELRTSDEGTTLTAKNGQTFDVRDVSGAQRGNMFTTVKLGTNANEAIEAAATATYINAGAGDDVIVGGAGADFLVGNGGNDQIFAGAGDSVIGGAGTDTVVVNGTRASYLVNDGTNAVTLTSQTGGTINLIKVAGVNSVENIRFSDATVTVEELIAPPALGQTYALTKALDNITGTGGNDTIIGSISATADLNTLNPLDIVNGGAGTDTLKIADDTGTIALPNMTGVEIVEVSGTAGVTVDTSAVAGITNLNVIKAAGAVTATGAATTDVVVDVKAAAAATSVVGGKNVTVKVADSAATTNTIAVGTGTAPKGDVVVEATAKAAVNGTNFTMGTVGVTGGKTISITQKAGDATGLVAGDTTATQTQGAVTATANVETTSVTIKQDAAVTAASTKAVAKVDEVATVTFTKLDSGQSATVAGLTFTAAKDLTAAQVAAAFANLSATAATPTKTGPTTATGDTNGGSVSANGVFSGALLAKWSSAAASGNTVTFTASGAMATDLAVSGTGATVITTTQGVDAVTGANKLGVVAGTVTVNGAAALKTVTVDGYAASTGTTGINGATNTVLDTISLANGGNFEIDSAAATLGLTLNKVNGIVTVTAGTKTLTANVNGGATDTATLVSGSAEAVNVTGAGNVAGTTATGLTAATAINTSGMTGGNATFTIADGTVTTYTGGAGVDNVTVTNASTAITKAIDLGAGNDTLTLSGAAVAPTATLKGGEGTDTIAMTGARAAALSANSTFADKIEGFEKLSITDKVTAAATVNMANMDGITYVVSNNTTNVATGATKTTFTVDVTGSTATANDTVAFDGSTYTFTAPAATAAAFATQLYALISATPPAGSNWVATGVSGTKITFEAVTAGVKATPANNAFVFADPDTTPNTAAFVTAEVTAGAASSTAPALTLDKMANNGTLELVDAGDGVVVKMADATGSTDSFNIVTKVAASDLSFGTLDIAGVETLKLNAVDSVVPPTSGAAVNTASLTVKADKATSLTIEGSSNVTLSLNAATNKLATIDAGTLTGKLSFAATGDVVTAVTGGSGADTLKASVGSTAKADVIVGGAGKDTLVAGSNGAKLTGGTGDDVFLVTATGTGNGNKESNTYSDVLDFQAGDVLQLQFSSAGTTTDVTKFSKLAATLNESTAVFSDFVNAAIKEAGLGEAVYFNFKGDAYVVVDSQSNSAGDVFINGDDLIVKLTGINGDNLSWNGTYATAALI